MVVIQLIEGDPPGSGPGLAISLESARLHGGGARFVLTLPRDLEDR
ncbi:hypothetical protein [Kibdelosporangium persicum]|nr:hypothetical protein [Kibdelosporangium persicum]